MKKVIGLVAAAVVVLGIVAFASMRVIGADHASASATPTAAAQGPAAANSKAATSVKVATNTKTYSLTAGGRKRSYEVIAPVTALPKSAPVIVMLSGIGSTVAKEISRDRLVDYAAAGQAEIVYPVAFDESWNAIDCCGKAAAEKVNDMAFLKALVATVNPGHTRRIYVVGYSNGTRLAYRIACDDPALFDGYAMVKGLPSADCAIRKPVDIVQMASTDDPEVPYKPGDKGSTKQVPVTTLASRLHAADGCPAKRAVTHSGTVTLTTWSGCADGTRLALAVWVDGVHSFPRPPASVPAAAQVLWSFFTKTPLAPLPG